MTRTRAALLAATTATLPFGAACSHDSSGAATVTEPKVHPVVVVPMNANDPGGSGANPDETFLNVANVVPGSFGKLATLAVDGDQFAQPLFVGGLTMADGAKHDVVFAATEHDSVYAFDAAAATGTAPLWKASVGTSAPLPSAYIEVAWAGREATPYCGGWGIRESGITGTPVIDPSSSTMYVLALDVDMTHTTPGGTCLDVTTCEVHTCDQPAVVYKLHALDLASGAEKFGGPVTVTGEASGAGAGSVDGVITFSAGFSLARPSLLLAYGNVYFASGSYSDNGSYHGWVFAYDAATLSQVAAWNDTPDGALGGIWQSGRGLVADGHGSVYAVTGNGTFDANNGGHDYGDAVVKLSADLATVQDYFTQQLSDYQGMNYLAEWDGDLGSAGATLIPGTSLLLASGKMGIGFLLDTGDLGKWSPLADNAAERMRVAWRQPTEACTDVTSWAYIYGTPVVWQGPDGMHLYVWGTADYLREYALDGNGKLADSGKVCFCPSWTYAGASIHVPDPDCAATHSVGQVVSGISSGGAALSLSSNGKEAGTGLLWVTRSTSGDAIHTVTAGALEAYAATDVSTPLYTSDQSAGDALGDWAKYAPPTVANGKVYVPTFSNQLVVYGLLP